MKLKLKNSLALSILRDPTFKELTRLDLGPDLHLYLAEVELALEEQMDKLSKLEKSLLESRAARYDSDQTEQGPEDAEPRVTHKAGDFVQSADGNYTFDSREKQQQWAEAQAKLMEDIFDSGLTMPELSKKDFAKLKSSAQTKIMLCLAKKGKK